MDNTQEAAGQLHTKKSSRMANMELLRCVSMMLVVVLHFLGKGGGLIALTESNMPASGYLAWGLESLAIVAVNVYMLISGYFLVESSFKVSRLLQLILQIQFYSIGIGLVGAVFGLLPEGGFGIHYLLMLCLPVSMNHYWFMTAYVFMYLFTPLLAAGIKKLSQKQMQTVVVLLVLLFSVVKSIVPGRLEADMQGYDAIWYLCVFTIAAYIRLYGIPFFKNKTRGLLVYLAAAAGILGVTLGLRFLYLKTGSFGTILTICYNYNHILVLVASVAFFYLFYHMRIKEGVFAGFVCRIAPYTLGVYLWHEHVALRYEWQQWLYRFTGVQQSPLGLLTGTVLAVVLVFTIGILLDMLRAFLFHMARKVLLHIGMYKRLTGFLDGLTMKKVEKNG